MKKMADVFGSTAESVLQKSADETVGERPYLIEGSQEAFINTVADPVRRAAGCNDQVDENSYHWPQVIGTFPDRAIVQCLEHGKCWNVPFTIKTQDGETIVETGEPTERVQAFVEPEVIASAASGESE